MAVRALGLAIFALGVIRAYAAYLVLNGKRNDRLAWGLASGISFFARKSGPTRRDTVIGMFISTVLAAMGVFLIVAGPR
jgi:hypothetical protein